MSSKFDQDLIAIKKELAEEEKVNYAMSNSEVVEKSKYIILAIKPQMFETAGTGTREKNVTCRTIEENLQMGYYLSRSTNGDMQGWRNHSLLSGRS